MARLIDMSLSRLGAGHPAPRVGLAQWVVFGGGGGQGHKEQPCDLGEGLWIAWSRWTEINHMSNFDQPCPCSGISTKLIKLRLAILRACTTL